MSSAKIVKLTARPSVCAFLSFEVGGIIEAMSVTLGQSVNAFNFVSYYGGLGVTTETKEIVLPGTPFKPGRIGHGPIAIKENLPEDLLNSADIASDVGGSQLMCLRAEGVKAALDKACALRANIYYSNFANQSDIIVQIRAFYDNSGASGKLNYLQQLSNLASQQYNQLNTAYQNANPSKAGVVPSTSSQLKVTDSNNKLTETQNMTYTDYGFRVPSIEAQAQNLRAQVSLMDEQFSQFMAGQNTSNLEDVFQNQMTAIDMDVKQIQVAYLNTILLSPISGVVTGIYKQVGDAVMAGQPVIRVEDSSTVWLVGVIIYRAMLSVGASVTVNSNAFSAAPAGTALTPLLQGTVLVARGDESGDDRWEVVISCKNTNASGNLIVTPNYHFDFDDTTITVN